MWPQLLGHDRIICRTLQICRKQNLRINKEKCHFRWTSIPCFGKIISRQGVRPYPRKLEALMNMLSQNKKRTTGTPRHHELPHSHQVLLITAEVCEALHRLTSVKTEKTGNKTYQDPHYKAKTLIKQNVCIKFYDDVRPLYLKTDASRVRLGAGLSQVHHGMNCTQEETPDNIILRDWLHLPTRTCQMYKEMATSKEKQSEYCMDWKNSMGTFLQER